MCRRYNFLFDMSMNRFCFYHVFERLVALPLQSIIMLCHNASILFAIPLPLSLQVAKKQQQPPCLFCIVFPGTLLKSTALQALHLAVFIRFSIIYNLPRTFRSRPPTTATTLTVNESQCHPSQLSYRHLLPSMARR